MVHAKGSEDDVLGVDIPLLIADKTDEAEDAVEKDGVDGVDDGGDDDAEDWDDAGEVMLTLYFIMQRRRQPEIPDCDGNLEMTPEQLNDPKSLPVPENTT